MARTHNERVAAALALLFGGVCLFWLLLILSPGPEDRSSLQSAMSAVAESIRDLQRSEDRVMHVVIGLAGQAVVLLLIGAAFWLKWLRSTPIGSLCVLGAAAIAIVGASSQQSEFVVITQAPSAVLAVCALMSISAVQVVAQGWTRALDVVLARGVLRPLRTLVAMEVAGGIFVAGLMLAAALFNHVQYRETWPRLHLLTLTLTPIVLAGIVMGILSMRCPACRQRLLWVATGVKQALRATWGATRCPHCSEDVLHSNLKLSDRPVADWFDRWFVLPAAEAKPKR